MNKRMVPIADAPNHGIPGTSDSLHWVAFHREYNGAKASGAIIKFGGRLYIDPDKYIAWMSTGPRISPPVKRSRSRKEIKQAPRIARRESARA